MATDTAWIKYNRIANAGEADTICYNFDGVRLGNAYDYSLFLGFLNYKGGKDFKDIFYEYTQNDSNFFRNFSVFMKQDEFISSIENCAPTFYSNFKTLFWRDSLINQTWFKDYWVSLLVFDDPKYFQLDTFTNRILESASLTDHINSLDDWSSISSCVFDVFKLYYDFQIANNINVSSTWTKLVDNDSMVMDEWNNRVLTYDYPTKNTIYINNVITPSYAEIDEVNILVDTAIQVYFTPVFQSDSSVFFESLLTPNQGNPIYAWNFGDGTAINHEANPFHTFTAFDSSYKVCLTVFNLCGTYTFCDTVYIDSLHWGGSIEKVNTIKSKNETIKPHLMNLEVMVYPNPTESNALLVYKSEEEHFEGKLVITDIGGRSIWDTDLKQKSGNIKIPSQHWNDGLYFFHLQTSSGTKTRKLIVRH
jgi:PKD repeat protein